MITDEQYQVMLDRMNEMQKERDGLFRRCALAEEKAMSASRQIEESNKTRFDVARELMRSAARIMGEEE